MPGTSNSKTRMRALVLALGLFLVMLGIGIAAVTSSGYRSVCSLAELDKPEKVVVSGKVAQLQTARVAVKIGDAVFLGTSSFSPTYTVVERVQGSFGRLDTDDRYAVFVLYDDGCQGSPVVAVYSASTFESRYGAHAVFSEEVVVEGYYQPTLHAVIYDPMTGHIYYEGPVVIVTQILKGCHEAYGQGAATTS
ncbi:hypothetical protein Pyrfu_1848 [Pyrolobus fumarii 1A]|uniref:Uncharacterized protein n=1 Tax=Pyrolobus fumarii (strain DSM 11204 / 1A) TaxID=694429 RepID=G0ECY1_PYRF1|nr:hypothetical protein [Pyrolobus fumarii]AEM39701.1 hypothetical protein Pyrfu_1848 [Pyrolobus fumarii 1A]